MGAVFAAAARAPITAVIIIFELTGDYAIILPLMVAIVLSAGLSSLLSGDTIYTLKLRRRGIDIARSRSEPLGSSPETVDEVLGAIEHPNEEDADNGGDDAEPGVEQVLGVAHQVKRWQG